ncbi:MFS transporter [Sphaerisporangium siamense]|uniref:MFS family permease n=1 Tax=Sphaerisporangium siamense TaxID=795645 RepID=A0A7W7G9C8_9ACTN|nr:MFS transporter [Sphaerisporangium siamense]MBB4700465.1 MFS family permease [Sphaerisporangium siamense]GII88372.1 MFS transporter [Sphaerisporangium siamense]
MVWRAAARRFPVLAIRDFRLLLADRLLAPAAVAFSVVGVSFAVLDLTGSTADLSYVLAAQIAPALVFTLISGVVSDRVPPQRVIVAANVVIAVSEGLLGVLVLSGGVRLWHMIVLETLTGVGMAVLWPAMQSMLPKIVPDELLQQANAVSRLAMNGAQMGGAAVAGLVVAAVGPGWAMAVCGVGLLATVPMLLSIRASGHERTDETSMVRDLRDGWSEFRSHTWLWTIVAQYCVVLMAWYGGFQVLGPPVAKEHLGGAAAWGAITAAEALGLIVGGVISLRFTPRRPLLLVVSIGAILAVSPLSLAMRWPLVAICLATAVLGVFLEIMMVQWSVTLTRNVPPEKLARVSAYDALGSVMAMPVGALVAGPLADEIGLSATQYGAAALMVAASSLAILPRDVRRMRSSDGRSAPSVPAASPSGS